MIQEIGYINHFNTYKRNGSVSESKRPLSMRREAGKLKDRYEPSSKEPFSTNRLNKIRQRIKNGHYNSLKIADDISDSMADLIEKTL